MKKKDEIKVNKLMVLLSKKKEKTIIDIWNELCCYNYDEMIFYMNEFNEYFEDMDCTPTDIVESLSESFSLLDKYFWHGEDGLDSFNDIDHLIDLREMCYHIVEQNDDCGRKDIREILDSKD